MKKTIKNLVFVLILALVAVMSFSYGKSLRPDGKIIKTPEDNVASVVVEKSEIMSNIESLIERIESEYLNEFDMEALEVGIYKGILASLQDPYSVYFSKEEYKALMEDTDGEFGGIGVQVTPSSSGYIEVVSPIKGTPGEAAGIQPGDYVTHVNGQAYDASQMDAAVKIIRGEPGTDVTITILRGMGAEQEIFDLTITREIIVVESVYAHMLDNNIGYIQLTGFQKHTDSDFVKAVENLKRDGATSLILDLRNNPGGLLDQVLNIADYLLDEGVVISVRYKDEWKNEELKAEDGKEDMPLVVLINQGSASASEVLSGALQDSGRATLVGETSFGKGVIQQIYPVYNQGREEGMKLTIAEFYTPNGNKIHGVGISPDYPVKLPEGVTSIGVEHLEEDIQLQKAIELLK